MRERAAEANSIDLSGKVFGNLTAIKRIKDHITSGGNPLTVYRCKCACGNYVDVLAMNLVSGNTQSCGCVGHSRAEKFIAERLSELGIPYRKEYTYPDLLSEKGSRLKFDFALFNDESQIVNCLIEYNGEQHYYEEGRSTYFGKQQRDKTDAQKKDYCEQNGITLFIIPYYEDLESKINEIIDFYLSSKH